MDGEPSWISMAVASLLCAIAGALLIVLIAQSARLHNSAQASTYGRGDTLIALRLLK